MRRTFLAPLAIFAFFAQTVAVAKAQSGPEVIDVRPYAPSQGSEMETVSLTNGSVDLHIPVWSFPQRGSLRLDFTLRYDVPTFALTYECMAGPGGAPHPNTQSSGTHYRVAATTSTATGPVPLFRPPVGSCTYPNCDTDEVDEACTVAWDMQVSNLAIFPFARQDGVKFLSSTDVAVTLDLKIATSQDNPNIQFMTGYTFHVHSSDGGTHALYQTAAGDFRVLDASGWEYQANSCTLRDGKGNRYVFACAVEPSSYYPGPQPFLLQYAEDPNGNRITLRYSTNQSNLGEFLGWTDTMGRIIPGWPTRIAATNPSLCPGSSGASEWQPPDSNVPVTFCGVLVPMKSAFWPETGNPYAVTRPDEYTEYNGGIGTIGAVILPSGDKWTFSYQPLPGDQYAGTDLNLGELRQIGLPTGGTIRYKWAHTMDLCGVTPQETMARSFVIERDVSESISATPAVWLYASAPAGVYQGQVYGTGFQDPYGNGESYTNRAFGRCSFFATQVDHVNSTGSLIYSDKTDYQQLNTSILSGIDLVQTGVVPLNKYKVWADGTQNKTSFTYEPGSTYIDVYGAPKQVSNGLELSESDYDFGTTTGVPGALLRSKATEYWAMQNGAASAQNMLDRPSKVTITDPVSGQVQQTTYGYDYLTLFPGNGTAPSWTANPDNGGVRGNLTTVAKSWDLNASVLTTILRYNDTGTIASVTLPSNSPRPDTTTTYDWSADYQGSLLTSTTNSLSQTSTYSYDPATLRLSSKIDPNFQTTTYSYYPDGRLYSITGPANAAGQHGQVTYAYPSSTQVEKSVKKDASSWITSEELYDGLGRAVTAQLLNGCASGDYIETNTYYDLLDRPRKVTNPHCHNSTSPTDGVIHYLTTSSAPGYDALGRPTDLALQDGSRQSWSYSDNSTTFHDEAGSTWQRTTDALGRLVKVVEPGNLVTQYTYDAFNNLTHVKQFGNGTETPVERSFTYDSLSHLITANNPETGPVCYGITAGSVPYARPGGPQPNQTAPDPDPDPDPPNPGPGNPAPPPPCSGGYDAHGNLVAKTDPRGVVVNYNYDKLNRLTGKTYQGTDQVAHDIAQATPPVQYFYDQSSYNGYSTPNGVGRRTGMHDGAGDTAWSYDATGRGASVMRCTDGLCWGPYNYSYNLDGTPDVTFGWKHSYDAISRETAMGVAALPTYIVSSATYTPSGQLASVSELSASNLEQSTQYNNRFQPSVMTAESQSQSTQTMNTVQSLVFGYVPGANNGNITDILDPLDDSRNQHYTYDGLNRLQTATAAGWSQSYTYDSFGNMTGMGNFSLPNAVPGTNRLQGLSYDAAGNVTNTGVLYSPSYAYDAEGRVSKVGNTVYEYDGDGQRVRKSQVGDTNPEDGQWFFRGLDGNVIEELGDNYFDYLYFGGHLVHVSADDGNEYWPIWDHLGTTRLSIALPDYVPTTTQVLYPFGGVVSGDNMLPYKFTGKERDAESGLDYFGARYYASSMGRWMSPDWSAKEEPVPYAKLDNPQSLNLYGYVLNNPLSQADSDGHEGCCDALAQFASAAMNAWSSDNLGGAGRQDQTTSAGVWGARFGDTAALTQGVYEGVTGVSGFVGAGLEAVMTSPAAGTGVGAAIPMAGVVTAGASAALTVHGVAVGGTAVTALMKSGGNFSSGTKQGAKDAAGGKCQNCGVETAPGQKSEKGVTPPKNEGQTDHIQPKSKGGSNDPSNAQHLCRDCNRQKSDKVPNQ